MAEMSGFFTTASSGAIGDQVSGYTQSHLSDAMAIAAATSGSGGVAPAYLNELACASAGANKLTIDSGGAMVDGKWYKRDASASINVPSAVGGGNTRIDRIVIRADWANFDVSACRVAGTDSASPSAPSVSSSPGTLFDVKLARVLVDTSGNLTVTDEREWAITDVDNVTLENNVGQLRVKDGGIAAVKLSASAVTLNSIADDAIYTAMIQDDQIMTAHFKDNIITEPKIVAGAVSGSKLANDSVDDTKAGNRVPQFFRRQGGSATDWASPGTSTQTPGAVRIQAGVITWTGGSANFGNFVVTFPTVFGDKPIVFAVAAENNAGIFANVIGSSTTSAAMAGYWRDVLGNLNTSVRIHWLAIGPE